SRKICVENLCPRPEKKHRSKKHCRSKQAAHKTPNKATEEVPNLFTRKEQKHLQLSESHNEIHEIPPRDDVKCFSDASTSTEIITKDAASSAIFLSSNFTPCQYCQLQTSSVTSSTSSMFSETPSQSIHEIYGKR